MPQKLRSYLALSGFLFLILGCSKKEISNPVPPAQTAYFVALTDPQVNKNVKVFASGPIVDEISNVSPTQLTFKKGSPAAQPLIVGDIIVSDTSKVFPYGTLRKIVSRSENATGITFTTEAASLNDVFASGSIHIEHELSNQSVKAVRGGRPGAIEPVDMSLSYKFTDNIILKGSGKAKPKFTFDWQKQPNSLEPSYAKMTLDLDTEYYVGLSFAAGTYDDEKLLKGFDFGVQRTIAFGVPIAFRLELNLYGRIKVTNPVDLSFGFEGTKNFHMAGVYKDGDWKSETSSTDLTVNFKPPFQVKQAGEVKLSFLKPVVEIHPYDIDGIALYLGVDLGSEVKFDCQTKRYNGDAYLKGILGAKTNFNYFLGAFKFKQKSDTQLDVDIAKGNLGSGSILCDQPQISGKIDLTAEKIRYSDDYQYVLTFDVVGLPRLEDDRFYYYASIQGPDGTFKSVYLSKPNFDVAVSNKIELSSRMGSGNYKVLLQVFPKSVAGFLPGSSGPGYGGSCCGPCYQNEFSLGAISYDEKGQPLPNFSTSVVIPKTNYYICNP